MLKRVLSFNSFVPMRWHTFHEGKNESIAVDTITFISNSEETTTCQIYTANLWIKYCVKKHSPETPFKMSLENIEVEYKFVNNNMGMAGKYRIVEFYGYGWDDKNNYHTKFDNPTWENVVPDSSKEVNMMKLIKFDLERKNNPNLI